MDAEKSTAGSPVLHGLARSSVTLSAVAVPSDASTAAEQQTSLHVDEHEADVIACDLEIAKGEPMMAATALDPLSHGTGRAEPDLGQHSER